MSKHRERMRAIGQYAHPELIKLAEKHIKMLAKCPHYQKNIEKAFKKTITIIEAQFKNGAGFQIDSLLRYFLAEYNNRNFSYGLNSMPSSFNVMEAFFEHRPELCFFRLRDEKDHLFSMPEFIDYVTSPDEVIDINETVDCMEEGVIYSYDTVTKIEDFTFSSNKSAEYAVAGVSLIRYGTEINMLLLTGEKTDLSEATKALKEMEDVVHFTGRESIKPSADFKREAVPLLGSRDFWQTLVLTRFDLNDATQDVRYLMRDNGDGFSLKTDDINPFINPASGKFDTEELKDVFKRVVEEIKEYNGIFEVCKSMLFLPLYFWNNQEYIVDERHQTKLFSEINKVSWLKKRKFLSPRERIGQRLVSILRRENVIHPNTTFYNGPEFKIERSGFWKKLPADKVGVDKKGCQIHGKTWIQQTLSWIEQDQPNNVVKTTCGKGLAEIDNPNKGYIYVMRSASAKKDIYKVGQTRRSPETRASEITRGTGVPTEFLVVEDWEVADCVMAEPMIHAALDRYRINERREFFKAPYKEIREIIEDIVRKINVV